MIAHLGNPFTVVPVPESCRVFKTWDFLQPPIPGQICYAIALWRPCKGCTWRPSRPDVIPPLTEGRYSLIFWESRDSAIVIRDVLDYNVRQLENAKKRRNRRIISWAASVQMIAGHDHTARILEGGQA
jgi:hypothetical protein